MINEMFEEMHEKSDSVIHLNPSDEVINNMYLTNEATTKDIWNNLGQMCITKNLSSKLYVKELYGLNMVQNTNLPHHLNTFNRLTLKLLQFG